MGQVLRVNETGDRCVERHARRDEDRQHDEQPGNLLDPKAAQKERDRERHGGQRITEVVDQISEQRDRSRQQKDQKLRDRC